MTNHNEQIENMSSEGLSQVESESLRHYYLETMGIQAWQLYGDAYQVDSCDDQLSTDAGIESGAADTFTQSPVSDLASLQGEIKACAKCELSNNQQTTVFGDGNCSAELMIIVLLPQPDAQIFSASEKTLLVKMLKAIDIEIDDVFITPLVKCAQPADIMLTAMDTHTCSLYIKQQIAFVKPSMLFVMGEGAAQCLFNTTDKIDDLREQDYQYQQLPTMISYSANDLLLQPVNKKKAWTDLQNLQKRLQDYRAS